MFFNLFGSKKVNFSSEMNEILTKLSIAYSEDNISDDRKEYLKTQIQTYGYLPYSQIKALEELSNEEVLFVLKEKLRQEKTLTDNSFNFTSFSPLKRRNIAQIIVTGKTITISLVSPATAAIAIAPNATWDKPSPM